MGDRSEEQQAQKRLNLGAQAPEGQADMPAETAGEAPGKSAGATGELVAPRPVGGGGFGVLLGVLKTLRPHQWVKNAFVLAPVVFAREIFDMALLTRAASAFGVFCLLAGAVYTMNDIVDVEADRRHPVKRNRPIPSGKVPIGVAKALALVLVLVALGAALLINLGFFIIALIYFIQNIAYSFKLKNVPYVDVGLIALGFVLRVEAGGYAAEIDVSNYLLVCTALLALFLGFGKRRHELASSGEEGKTRAALKRYSVRGLDIGLGVTALATVGLYLAYTLDPVTRQFFRSDYLWPSTVLVVAGVLRFLVLVRSDIKGESPTQEMLKDGPFVGIVMLWVGLVLWIVYNLRPGG